MRIGTWCFRRRWWVLLAWVVVAVIGVLAAGPLFSSMEDKDQLGNMEAIRGEEMLESGRDDKAGSDIVAIIEGVDPNAPTTTAALRTADAAIAKIDGVLSVEEPRIASDERGTSVQVVLLDGLDDADEEAVVKQVSDRFTALESDLAGAQVRIGGDAILEPAINDRVGEDLAKAEMFSFPVTAIVLVFVFGGLVVAGVPLLATLFTVVGSFTVLLGFSTVIDMDPNIVTIVTMLGLGLSVDYGLLLVARYREELARRMQWAPGASRTANMADRVAAIGATWATAGRTIAFSALTVAVALTSLLFVNVPRIQAMGAAGIAAVLVALLAALTFSAAMIRLCGGRIKPSKKELKAAASPVNVDRGFFAGLARFTQRRPLLTTLATCALLLVAAAPLLFTTYKLPSLEGLPSDEPSVAVAKDLDEHYGYSSEAAIVVVARMSSTELDDWARRWADHETVKSVFPAEAPGDGLAAVAIAVHGDKQSGQARDLVKEIREDRPASESWVTGETALIEDFIGQLSSRLPLMIGVVVVGMMVLLFLMTGSLVIGVKAIAMAVVSLGATFGVLVAVFDYGWFSGVLNTAVVDGISPIVMVFVFAFALGLSMDYEIFLLGRIKENVDAGMDTDMAVRRGLQRSGRIITSAALLMMIVFAGFATSGIFDIQAIGVGLFVAVLVDATIVRCLLVPATMTLLGRWNWWSPRWMRRIHGKVGLSESAPAERELVGSRK